MKWKDVPAKEQAKVLEVLKHLSSLRQNTIMLNIAFAAAKDELVTLNKSEKRWNVWLNDPEVKSKYACKYVAIHSECGVLAFGVTNDEVKNKLTAGLIDYSNPEIIITYIPPTIPKDKIFAC